MANIDSLAQDIQEIRKSMEILDDKINQVLAIMESFIELQDSEFADEDDDEDDYDNNEGWIGGGVDWFPDEDSEDD